MVADVELEIRGGATVPVAGRVKRDIDYSLDLSEPFYVSTSVGAEVTQLMGLNWDVVGRFRHGSLTYPQASATRPGRVDYVNEIGAGIGRRVGDNFRLGLDVSYVRRTSVLRRAKYEGFRLGGRSPMAGRFLSRVIACVACLLAGGALAAAGRRIRRSRRTTSSPSRSWALAQFTNKYPVGIDGAIEFPQLGRLKVSGLTARELGDLVAAAAEGNGHPAQPASDGRARTDAEQEGPRERLRAHAGRRGVCG